MARSLRCLFALWMAFVATGSVVAHRHGAELEHAHGYGWVSLRSGNALHAGTHRHLVLFGIECWACDDCGATEGAHAALSDCSAPEAPCDVPACGDLIVPHLCYDTVPYPVADSPAGRPTANVPGRATHIRSTILRL